MKNSYFVRSADFVYFMLRADFMLRFQTVSIWFSKRIHLALEFFWERLKISLFTKKQILSSFKSIWMTTQTTLTTSSKKQPIHPCVYQLFCYRIYIKKNFNEKCDRHNQTTKMCEYLHDSGETHNDGLQR